MAEADARERAAAPDARVAHVLARGIAALRLRRWQAVGGLVGLGLLASGGVLLLLAQLHEELFEPGLRGVDRAALQLAHAAASPPLTALMLALTALGSLLVVAAVALVAAGVALALRRWHDALGLLVALGGAAALTTLLKLAFQRPRPGVAWALAREDGFSFPSGHAMVGLVAYGMLAYVLWRALWRGLRLRRAAALATGLAALGVASALIAGIGASRVYLGVHYPSDVLAGFVAGAPWLLCAIVATEALRLLFPRGHRASDVRMRSDR